MRLTIGTAQFGLDYGYTNTGGKVSEFEATQIVKLAKSNGVTSFDTARNYGNSEEVLGKILHADSRITTKLYSKPHNKSEVDWVEHSLEESLRVLDRTSIDTLLVHNCDDLHDVNVSAIKKLISKLKTSKRIRRFGVSLYYPEQLKLVEKFECDTVQIPFNLVDRRFQRADTFAWLKGLGVEIEVRSVFLQGLLLLPSDQLPRQFVEWKDKWIEFDKWCSGHGVSRLHACLSFVDSFKDIDRIVIGVQDQKQFLEVFDAYSNPVLSNFPDLSCCDENLVIPSNWTKHG